MSTNVPAGQEIPGLWYGSSQETRPTPTMAGHKWYSTDTGDIEVWSGSGWFLHRIGGAQLNTDPLVEVMRGNVQGQSMVHKFGRNAAVPNGSWEFVNNLGFTAWPLSAATTVRVKAGGNANDTSGGSGAQTITVQGIDSNGDELSESITLAGASASSATTASFWRIHRAWVNIVGTYGGSNTGAITVENSAGGTDLIKMEASEGQTQFAGYTIPDGYKGYLMSLHISVDAGKAADFRVMTRGLITNTTAPIGPIRLKLFFDGVLGSFAYRPSGPELELAALSDIWVEARGGGAITEASADFELLLVEE